MSLRIAEASENLRVAAQALEATEDPKDDAGKVMPNENARRAFVNANAAWDSVIRACAMLSPVIVIIRAGCKEGVA
ncbi:MAG: hypothetical protein ACHQC8_06510 [Solirubrobacterales bacterium]